VVRNQSEIAHLEETVHLGLEQHDLVDVGACGITSLVNGIPAAARSALIAATPVWL
jgi:hypothetical protein